MGAMPAMPAMPMIEEMPAPALQPRIPSAAEFSSWISTRTGQI